MPCTAVFSSIVPSAVTCHISALNSKCLRSMLFAKTMVSKEPFMESVSGCPELKDPWTIKTIWADMLPACFVSAALHFTKRRATNSSTLVHRNTGQICMSKTMTIMSLFPSKIEGRNGIEIASTTMVPLQASSFTATHEMQVTSYHSCRRQYAPFVRSTDWLGKTSQRCTTSSLTVPVCKGPGSFQDFEQVLKVSPFKYRLGLHHRWKDPHWAFSSFRCRIFPEFWFRIFDASG